MASRIAGAVLALIAAAALAASVIGVAWWSGHPAFKGVEIKAKEIFVGPLGAKGCNTGGDGSCMSLPVDATFETVGYALAGVTALVALVLVLAAIFSFAGAARRKSFAVLALVGALIGAGLGGVLVIVGPQVRTETPLPFGIGLYVFFAGIASAVVAAVVTLRSKDAAPVRKMQLAPARQSKRDMQPAPAASPGLDVRALVAEDSLRPSSLGREPMMGSSPPIQSPGGALPGPSGPLGALPASGPQPLFSSAPQLRPLYEVQGFVPKPNAPVEMRPPTPVPRDQISARAGIPTPASIQAQAGASQETDRDLLGAARRAAPKAKTLPPPLRNKPTTLPPPAPLATNAPVPPAIPLPKPPSVPPPPPPTTDDGEDFDQLKTAAAEPKHKPPSSKSQPPARPSPAPLPPPTTTSALPAKPAIAAKLAAAAIPPPKPAGIKLPMPSPASRHDTEEGTFDAMATHEAPPKPLVSFSRGAPKKRLLTEDIGQTSSPDTDIQAESIDENLPATESFERMARPPTATSTLDAAADDATADEDIAATRTAASTDVNQVVETPEPTAVADAPTPEPAPEPKKEPKLPITTAPDSLPPPTEKQQMSSGPSPACPQCEAPMAWVEAHLRFYCKSCKMYF